MKKLISYLMDNNIGFIGTNVSIRVVKCTTEQEIEIRKIMDSEKLFLSLRGSISSIDIDTIKKTIDAKRSKKK